MNCLPKGLTVGNSFETSICPPHRYLGFQSLFNMWIKLNIIDNMQCAAHVHLQRRVHAVPTVAYLQQMIRRRGRPSLRHQRTRVSPCIIIRNGGIIASRDVFEFSLYRRSLDVHMRGGLWSPLRYSRISISGALFWLCSLPRNISARPSLP